jgi:hypothetical protein
MQLGRGDLRDFVKDLRVQVFPFKNRIQGVFVFLEWGGFKEPRDPRAVQAANVADLFAQDESVPEPKEKREKQGHGDPGGNKPPQETARRLEGNGSIMSAISKKKERDRNLESVEREKNEADGSGGAGRLENIPSAPKAGSKKSNESKN